MRTMWKSWQVLSLARYGLVLLAVLVMAGVFSVRPVAAQEDPPSDFRPVITSESTDAIGTTFLVTITFDRDVPELPRRALVIHGGSVVEHGQRWKPLMSKPNGREWKAHIEPGFDFTGTLTIDIPAGTVRDADGNPNLAAVQYTRIVKAEHVRPRLFMDLAPVEGTPWYRDPLEPVSGPFTVRIKFVTDKILHQAVTGLTVDEVTITNGVKTDFRQVPFVDGGALGDYEVTVTPDTGYTGPFTVEIEEGAAYGCADGDDLSSCDPGNLSYDDTLVLHVVALEGG